MLFDDAFIQSLRDEPVTGTVNLCDHTFDELTLDNFDSWTDDHYDVLLEAYALLVEIIDSDLLPMKLIYPAITGEKADDCRNLFDFIKSIRDICGAEASKLRVTSLRQRFRVSLGSGFAYEFSQGDLERVQHLVNQLREQIAAATQLERDHQQRLLRRLETLQSELHKKVSDLDRFWGLIGDAGVVLGKLGNDAKPIVDRIREIADIVWQTQSRAEELPSGTKLPTLEHKTTHDFAE